MNFKEKLSSKKANPEGAEKKEVSVNKVKAIVVAILVFSYGLSSFIHSDYLENKRLAAEAKRQEIEAEKLAKAAEEEARRIEEAKQAERAQNLILYKDKLVQALSEGKLSDVKKYSAYLKDDYNENTWVDEQVLAYRPSAPLPSVKEGVYESNFSLSFQLDSSVPGNALYNGEIHYEVTPSVVEEDGKLTFTENNTYSITAYTTNQLGLQSSKATYTYTLNKLIPNMVVADIGSGYFSTPVKITLSQDQNFPIYYTTDGSEVTTESHLYTGPFDLKQGGLSLRVRAYAQVSDMMSEETNLFYHIIPPSSGLESNRMLLTTRGTFVNSNNALQLVVDGESKQVYSTNKNVDAFCEYQDGILYTIGNVIYFMDLNSGESQELFQAPGSVQQLFRAGNRIFALTTVGELLYLHENSWIGFQTNVKSVCHNSNGSKIYYVSDSNVFELDPITLNTTAIFNDEDGIKEIAADENRVYYTTGKGEFKSAEIQSGQTNLHLKYTYTRDHRSPYVSGFLQTSDGYTKEYEQMYDMVMVANGRVYLRSDYRLKYTHLDYWSDSKNSSSTSHTYSWIVFSAETMEQEGTIQEGTINVATTPIIGDGYYAKAVGQGIFAQAYTLPAAPNSTEQPDSAPDVAEQPDPQAPTSDQAEASTPTTPEQDASTAKPTESVT